MVAPARTLWIAAPLTRYAWHRVICNRTFLLGLILTPEREHRLVRVTNLLLVGFDQPLALVDHGVEIVLIVQIAVRILPRCDPYTQHQRRHANRIAAVRRREVAWGEIAKRRHRLPIL